ncbi:MAG: serine hydrolase [Bacteroidota bacterium]
MPRLLILPVLLFVMCTSHAPTPSGDYIGFLKFPGITYHIYLGWQGALPVVKNVTFKAGEFSLDTLYFTNDSLHFRLHDFYSEYRGHYNRNTNQITGLWIGEDSTVYPLNFVAANGDTISGLHPHNYPTYTYQPPPQEEDGITCSTVSNQHINATAIDSLIERIADGHYTDIHSILVARHNQLVLEEYFYRYDRNYVYNIQSATKSVVSALIGISLEKGEIKNVKETLCANLPGYETWACTAANKDLTLHQLLTMSTGIPWDEQTYDYMDNRNSLSNAANEKDQFVHLLSLPRVASATPVFAYNSLNHILINAVLRNATHLENKEELETRLLQPLGIEKSYISEPSPMGAIGDIGLRPRDMLKFGLLYLNDGVWNGQRVVPTHWVRESTSTKIHPRSTVGYGYFWWTKDFQWKGKMVSSFFAWGYGGQYIFVIPEVRLVIVMSGSKWTTDPESQAMEIVNEILAASE